MSTLREYVRSVLTEQYVDFSAWMRQVDEMLLSKGEAPSSEQGIPQQMMKMRFDRGDSPEKVVQDMMGYEEDPFADLRGPRTSRDINDY